MITGTIVNKVYFKNFLKLNFLPDQAAGVSAPLDLRKLRVVTVGLLKVPIVKPHIQ